MIGLHAKVEESLRSKGMRYTANRKALVSALDQTSGPLTVDQLRKATERRVPFSSLYREVRVLIDAEVLSMHHGADRSNRFELAEWLAGHHHHMVCIRCMAISDVAFPPDIERRLARVVDEAAANTGYRVTDHSLELAGLCPDCLE